MSLFKDISNQPDQPTPAKAKPVANGSMSLIKEFSSVQTALKNSDQSDAGKSDVSDKASASQDIGFNLMRNTINANGEVTGSDVTNYIERAEELNDEVDTVPFGLETDDGQIVKVYVNAEQADKFEEAMKNMLGLEDDIEEAINRLSTEFDIVDVVWPQSDAEDGEEAEEDPDADLSIDDTSNLDDDDFADDQYDVIASADKAPDATIDDEEPVGDTISTSKNDDDETPSEDDVDLTADADEDENAEGESDDEDSEDDPDNIDPDKPKKKKKKKAAPAEPVSATENRIVKGSLLQEVNRATNNS